MPGNEKRFKEKIKAIQDTMFVIGGKWKLPIILSVYEGNKRFNDILHSIPGITNRVLSKELKHLEEHGQNFLDRLRCLYSRSILVPLTASHTTHSIFNWP